MFGGELADFVGEPIAIVATPSPTTRCAAPHYLRARWPKARPRPSSAGCKARDGREFWVVGNAVRRPAREPARAAQLTFALLDIERRRQAEVAHRAGAGLAAAHHRDRAAGDRAVRCAQRCACCRLNQMAAHVLRPAGRAVLGRTPEEMLRRRTTAAAAARRPGSAALAATDVPRARVPRCDGSDGGEPRVWDARYRAAGRAGAGARRPAAAGGQRRDRAARGRAGALRGRDRAARDAGARRCTTASRTTCRAWPACCSRSRARRPEVAARDRPRWWARCRRSRRSTACRSALAGRCAWPAGRGHRRRRCSAPSAAPITRRGARARRRTAGRCPRPSRSRSR